MTISTPYGVTCQIFDDPSKLGSFLDHEVTDLRNLASSTANLIVRVQFSTHQVVANCTSSSPLSCYDFSIVDQVVQAINANGMICHLGFNADAQDAQNGWLKGTCPATGKQYMLAHEWAIFASNVATYYSSVGKPHIEIIECGNEDYNTNGNTGTCNQPTVAAHTATQVYQAVKAVNSAILVGAPATISINSQCGGPPGNACDWWRTFFQASPQADFVNYHQYPGGVSCCGNVGTCYTLLQEAQYIRSLQGASFIPLWCTEIGFQIGHNTCEGPPPDGAPIDDVIQANLLMEAMNVGRTSGGLIQAICWYTMYYGDTGYSLIHPKGVIHPAYTTYQNFIAQYPTWT